MRALCWPTVAFLAVLVLGFDSDRLQAQGLIWALPEDGTSIHYSGTYKHTQQRPDSTEGPLVLQWDRQLWIKSVGREQARFRGEEVTCRWVEIKVITGKPTDEGIDPGLVGARVYKVLIPEPAIQGQLVDGEQIPVAAVPIVRGFQRFGEGEVKPITSGILQVNPLLAFIPHLRSMTQAEGTTDPALQWAPESTFRDPVEATQWSGAETIESRTTRSTTELSLWRSQQVPFGLAKWTAKVSRERKDTTDPRTAFEEVSTVEVTMQADRIDLEAQSELATPGS